MRRLGIVTMMAVFLTSAGFAQSNTTAGLAGAGAGAALGAASAGQGGTTPSSVVGAGGGGGGGASTPIEIQIMAFDGLTKIANDVAGIAAKLLPHCGPGSDNEGYLRKLEGDARELQSEAAKLQQDRSSDHPSDLEADRDKFMADLAAFDNYAQAKPECEILVEDPTSSNQIALYQAVQTYYDQLGRIHERLQDVFALQIDAPPISFSMSSGATTPPAQRITVSNKDAKPVNVQVAIVPPDAFQATSDCLGTPLDVGKSCSISVTFNPPDTTTVRSYKAILRVSNDLSSFVFTVPLSGEIKPLTDAQLKERQDFLKKLQSLRLPPDRFSYEIKGYDATHELAVAAPAPPAAPTSAAPAAAATTPIGLTYLSDVMTALAGAKATNTYAPSSFQPTTQAFETLVQEELRRKGIRPYTSTSPLNFANVTSSLGKEFGLLLTWGNDITNWTNQCKPATGAATPAVNSSASTASNSACTSPTVTVDLAVAAQLAAGYTGLLSTASDGSGNPVIVDVLRGKVLSDKIAKGIPSLQVAVAAAGGSSKTNSPFFVGLFYQWAPSYDAGAIATFELRDKYDDLVASGARSVLYGYGKWNGGSFRPKEELEKKDECTFCSSK